MCYLLKQNEAWGWFQWDLCTALHTKVSGHNDFACISMNYNRSQVDWREITPDSTGAIDCLSVFLPLLIWPVYSETAFLSTCSFPAHELFALFVFLGSFHLPTASYINDSTCQVLFQFVMFCWATPVCLTLFGVLSLSSVLCIKVYYYLFISLKCIHITTEFQERS